MTICVSLFLYQVCLEILTHFSRAGNGGSACGLCDDLGRGFPLSGTVRLSQSKHHETNTQPYPRHDGESPDAATGRNVLPPPQDGGVLPSVHKAESKC